MNYTVFQTKSTGSRFISSYTEKDETDWYDIIGHSKTIEDAQAMCNVTKELNIETFIKQSCGAMSPELQKLTRSLLK